jgi:hypothetical protein
MTCTWRRAGVHHRTANGPERCETDARAADFAMTHCPPPPAAPAPPGGEPSLLTADVGLVFRRRLVQLEPAVHGCVGAARAQALHLEAPMARSRARRRGSAGGSARESMPVTVTATGRLIA